MKKETNTLRARYERPVLKTFSVSVEGYICLSGEGLQEVRDGGEISSDF